MSHIPTKMAVIGDTGIGINGMYMKQFCLIYLSTPFAIIQTFMSNGVRYWYTRTDCILLKTSAFFSVSYNSKFLKQTTYVVFLRTTGHL